MQFLPIGIVAHKFAAINHQALLRLQTNDGIFFRWRWEARDESRPKHIQTRLPATNTGARQKCYSPRQHQHQYPESIQPSLNIPNFSMSCSVRQCLGLKEPDFALGLSPPTGLFAPGTSK